MITVEEPTVVVVQDPPAPKVVEVQARGPQGPAGTVAVGTVVTGAEGSDVIVTNSGTQTAAVLNFSIPRGNTGNAGLAATIAVGSVSTGAPGSAVTFTNVGTANAAIFNISIPRGDTGAAGSNAWAAITGKPTTIVGYGITDAYANPMTTAGDLTVGGALGVPTRLAIGTNGYFLKVLAGAVTWADFFAEVRAATLTGISFATGTAITAADTVLSALGKLQKQITDLLTATYATGDMVDTFATTARAGFVMGAGKTIGNAASGATERANADTLPLFTLLYNSMTNTEAPVSGGRTTSAAADFALNKTITLPDLRGRVAAGKDDMGGTAANRITSGAAGFAGNVLGASGGTQTHTLSQTEMPSHTHAVSDPTHAHGIAGSMQNYGVLSGGSSVITQIASMVTGASATGITNNSTGGSGAHLNTQPTYIVNKIIKL